MGGMKRVKSAGLAGNREEMSRRSELTHRIGQAADLEIRNPARGAETGEPLDPQAHAAPPMKN
jgi:hypothetical protein